ncbi:neurotrimin-like [Linepithema humile]|uniref:neurotrimin-like n=1 Tax=Linepithema humile TaxID=83485 RepID=UPI000623103A|nr:PREDICTED: neurotrimin-like [Linepithema humile]
MLPPRILGLLVILLAVQGSFHVQAKPTKSTEDLNYEDDTPFEKDPKEEEYEDAAPDASPQILSHSQSFRVFAGNTIILPCQVVHSEDYAIIWSRDNEYLYVESQPQISDHKRVVRLPNNSLAIYNATVNDSSNNYKCSIRLGNSDTVDVIHRVLVDPVDKKPHGIIRVVPESRIKVKQGDSVRLGCETDIHPQLEIKWFIENMKVDDYDPNVIVEDNYIVIKKANKSHSGLYQCLAEDGSKNPPMEAITVSVLYPPELEVKRNMIHSGTGIESEMTCIVSANPPAIMKWFKDDKEIIHKKGSIVIHHGSMKNNKTKHVLKILHTSVKDFGEYRCVAENFLGNETKYITLTGTPSQAKIAGAEMSNDDAKIILKWHLESYSPISDSILQYRRKGDEKWNIVHPKVKENDKENEFTVEHPIEELQPGSYEAILTAKNDFGWSTASEPHMFTGDYPPEMYGKAVTKEGNSAALRSSGILLALILVVLSCAFTSL